MKKKDLAIVVALLFLIAGATTSILIGQKIKKKTTETSKAWGVCQVSGGTCPVQIGDLPQCLAGATWTEYLKVSTPDSSSGNYGTCNSCNTTMIVDIGESKKVSAIWWRMHDHEKNLRFTPYISNDGSNWTEISVSDDGVHTSGQNCKYDCSTNDLYKIGCPDPLPEVPSCNCGNSLCYGNNKEVCDNWSARKYYPCALSFDEHTVKFAEQEIRYFKLVFHEDNVHGHVDAAMFFVLCSEPPPIPVAPSCEISGPRVGTVGQNLTYTASADGTDLASLKIWVAPSGTGWWDGNTSTLDEPLAETTCSGNSCSVSGNWLTGNIDPYWWVSNSLSYQLMCTTEGSGGKCSGNPSGVLPPGWQDCGPNDNLAAVLQRCNVSNLKCDSDSPPSLSWTLNPADLTTYYGGASVVSGVFLNREATEIYNLWTPTSYADTGIGGRHSYWAACRNVSGQFGFSNSVPCGLTPTPTSAVGAQCSF